MGLEPGHLVGLFAGHNFALKGLKPLLEGLGERRRRNPAGRPIHLLVCGGGATPAYARLAGRLGLTDTVHFLGFYPSVEDCYWSSDFFVQPTYYDPCSLVVMEALACGLPVITTAQNGAGEIMENGREGFVLSKPDAQGELITALDQMTDDVARRAMSAKASALGRYHTFDVHVARLIAIFEEVAVGRSRRAPHSRAQKAHQTKPHFARSRKSWR
jgi:UDP-glucose:(heptosyl)LPS alpha-1,3-glucosyltransferase